jgi:hypothetical protein
MTPTTDTIRAQAVMTVHCDIPQELTIAEYRANRPKPASRRKRGRMRLHRRRSG